MEFKDRAEKVKEIFNITSFDEMPEKLMEIVLNNDTKIYDDYLAIVEEDINFLQSIYQYYLSDREELKQDFTPTSLSKLCNVLTNRDNEKTIYDLCSGTGSLTLQKELKDKEIICHELNTFTISTLLFNLVLKNAEGIIIEGDALTNENKNIYLLLCGEKYARCEKA